MFEALICFMYEKLPKLTFYSSDSKTNLQKRQTGKNKFHLKEKVLPSFILHEEIMFQINHFKY